MGLPDHLKGIAASVRCFYRISFTRICRRVTVGRVFKLPKERPPYALYHRHTSLVKAAARFRADVPRCSARARCENSQWPSQVLKQVVASPQVCPHLPWLTPPVAARGTGRYGQSLTRCVLTVADTGGRSPRPWRSDLHCELLNVW